MRPSPGTNSMSRSSSWRFHFANGYSLFVFSSKRDSGREAPPSAEKLINLPPYNFRASGDCNSCYRRTATQHGPHVRGYLHSCRDLTPGLPLCFLEKIQGWQSANGRKCQLASWNFGKLRARGFPTFLTQTKAPPPRVVSLRYGLYGNLGEDRQGLARLARGCRLVGCARSALQWSERRSQRASEGCDNV